MKVQANPLFRTLIGLMIVISLFVIPAPAHAQSELTPYLPVDGQITSVGTPQTWTFSGLEGEVISLYARSNGDGLDPALTLTSSADMLISQNDDIAYPGATDALLQAVTLPRTDTYTVTVSGYKETIGGYSLTLLHGYPDIALVENFDDQGTDNWKISQPDLILDQVAGKLALSLSGIKTSGYVTGTDDENLSDFYADAMISDAEGQGGWIGGLILRQQNDRYYALVVNAAGQWRFTLNSASGEKVLRDWTNHPAIQAGQTSFRLGVLANGNGFDVFYNSLYVGQALDPDRTLTEGKIGFYVETGNAADSTSLMAFEDLTVTLPHRLGDADVIPDQLVSGAQGLTIQELERRRVIPAGGQIGLTVPESFGQRVNPGINRIALGNGITFDTMVFNTTLSWQTASPGVVGCGLVFDGVSDTQYNLAYIDQTGGYGLSARLGDSFSPGIFGINPDWTEGKQNLLVVRLADKVHYYVNCHYVGTMALAPSTGEIGIAVVNYETIDTTCQFDDTWIWRLASP